MRPGSGARLRLTKRIPVGAGLGGGSSDAAAVLRALAAALGGVSPGRLREIGASLGSDVPFFLGGSPLARGTGRGERLEPLPALPPLDIVLVSPPVAVSTREAYQTLGLTRTDGQTAADSSRMGLTAWEDLPELASNDFEVAIGLLHPQVPRALHALRSAGAQVALMTGSGSTCFGTFADPSDAAAAATELRHELGWACVAARTLADVPEVRQG